MRNSLLGVLVLLCSVTAVMAQPAERATTTFEEALLAKSRTMQTICCRFEQTQSLAVLAREVTKQGRFYYVQPDRLALLFDDGDYIRLCDEERNGRNEAENRYQPDAEAVAPLVSRLHVGRFEPLDGRLQLSG